MPTRRRPRDQAAGHDLGGPRRVVGADRADPRGSSAPRRRPAAPANWRKVAQRDHLPDAERLPVEQLPERFGPKSTVHDWFQRWAEGGVFEKIWAVLVAECDELGGGAVAVAERPTRCWARPGSGGKKTGKNPTDRGKKGHQEEPAGRRRRRAAGGGDRRGQRRRTEALEGDDRGDRGRAARSGRRWSRTCAWTRGTTTRTGRAAAAEAGYIPHIRRIGEEKKACDGRRATSRGGGWWK